MIITQVGASYDAVPDSVFTEKAGKFYGECAEDLFRFVDNDDTEAKVITMEDKRIREIVRGVRLVEDDSDC
jgi:hypothetical protein